MSRNCRILLKTENKTFKNLQEKQIARGVFKLQSTHPLDVSTILKIAHWEGGQGTDVPVNVMSRSFGLTKSRRDFIKFTEAHVTFLCVYIEG